MMPLRSALERPHGRPEFPLAGGSPSCLKTGHVQSGRPRCGNWRAPGRIFLILRTSVRPAPRIGREHGYRRRFTISPVNPATSAALCGTPCSCSIPTRSFIPSRDRGRVAGRLFSRVCETCPFSPEAVSAPLPGSEQEVDTVRPSREYSIAHPGSYLSTRTPGGIWPCWRNRIGSPTALNHASRNLRTGYPSVDKLASSIASCTFLEERRCLVVTPLTRLATLATLPPKGQGGEGIVQNYAGQDFRREKPSCGSLTSRTNSVLGSRSGRRAVF